ASWFSLPAMLSEPTVFSVNVSEVAPGAASNVARMYVTSGVASALSALYRLLSMAPCPHLSAFTGTLTSTRLSALGGAASSCAAAALTRSRLASMLSALQLQSCNVDVPSIQSLLAGATATRAVS